MSEPDEKEAAALRRALDEGVAGEDTPAGALEAAALIRYAKDGGALDPAASERILGELHQVQDRLQAGRARPKRWAWLSALALGTAAAAATMVLTVAPRPAPAPPPAPPAALIRAQIDAARGSPGALELEMRAYRRRMASR